MSPLGSADDAGAAGVAAHARWRRAGWLKSEPWLAHLVLIAACAFVVVPLAWMLLTTLKTHDQVFNEPMWWVPPEPQLWANLQHVFARIDFLRYFANSTIVATSITLLDLLFSTLCGYALAKYEFPGRRIVFAVILGTMMVPFIVLLIPQYILVRSLGWLNSYTGLIIPVAISSFGIFLMRQALAGTPDELIDAARIDGAGEWRILFQIVVPLHVPALISLAILRFLGEWDNLLWPLVVTNGADMRTMSLGLALMQDDRYGTDVPMLMTAAALALAPIVIAYAFLQRYFIKSVAGSGLKS